MKRIGGPRTGVGRFMVNQMKKRKQLFVMHEPMRKIKISVVHHKHNWIGQQIVNPTELRNVVISSSIFCYGGHRNQRIGNGCKNYNC